MALWLSWRWGKANLTSKEWVLRPRKADLLGHLVARALTAESTA